MNPEETIEATLPELVARLRNLHTQKTPLGWPTETAVSKSTVERRIFERIAREDALEGRDAPADRIHCELAIKIRSANRPSTRSSVVNLRVGGMFVVTEAPFTVGERVEIEVETDNNYRLRVQGNVGWVAGSRDGQPAGVGITFQSVVGDQAERRVERLVLELLRNRVEK